MKSFLQNYYYEVKQNKINLRSDHIINLKNTFFKYVTRGGGLGGLSLEVKF
jgi:hypothetical protein